MFLRENELDVGQLKDLDDDVRLSRFEGGVCVVQRHAILHRSPIL